MVKHTQITTLIVAYKGMWNFAYIYYHYCLPLEYKRVQSLQFKFACIFRKYILHSIDEFGVLQHTKSLNCML